MDQNDVHKIEIYSKHEIQEVITDTFNKEEQLKHKEYDWIREQIAHEDTLINHRLNWLLLAQGFLFIAFGTVHSAILANKPHYSFVICFDALMTIIYFFAAYMCNIVGLAVACACEQWSRLINWWFEKYPQDRFKVNIETGIFETFIKNSRLDEKEADSFSKKLSVMCGKCFFPSIRKVFQS